MKVQGQVTGRRGRLSEPAANSPHAIGVLSHWPKRIGEKPDILSAETLRLAHDTGVLRKRDLARVTVNTTVHPRNVTFPTDAKPLETAIRQPYRRVAKRAWAGADSTQGENVLGPKPARCPARLDPKTRTT